MNKFILSIMLLVSICFATKIGVLKADKNFSCNEEITIELDAEDTRAKTRIVDGDDDPPVSFYKKRDRIIFNYCILDINEMPKAPFSYAVLRLDEECPSGTAFQFARHHDTENWKNANSPKKSKTVWPSVINKDATLEYCFVAADYNSNNSYPIFDKKNGHKYGVFANPKYEKTINGHENTIISPYIAHSEIFIDDEDDPVKTGEEVCEPEPYLYSYPDGSTEIRKRIRCHDTDTGHNDNHWNYYITSTSFITKMMEIAGKITLVSLLMNGDEDTAIHVIKWTGTANAMLAKAVAENSNETPLVAPPPSTCDQGN